MGKVRVGAFAALLAGVPLFPQVVSAAGTQPVVAIHDSELTRALESATATGVTPTGPGTTGFQWWPTNWNYFVMPEAVKEALRSDGTAFTVLGDSNISSGALLDGSGKPIYPILISLASEAINDSEIAQLTNYVAAGGYLLVGSSAFTRNPDGSPRGDFAIAAQMGLDSATPNLTNWVLDSTFTKVGDHRLVSHIPEGTLHWKWPVSADEISLGVSPNFGGPLNHYIWQVTPNGATVLANGDSSPYLLVRPYGKGWFIYHAAMQPLLGHGGYDSGMYAYVIFRRAIEWAFQSAGLPVAKLSPWPYSYDAAVLFRHDMEDFPSFINSIEASAQYEHSMGAKGDYYFCTGALRNNYSASDRSNEVASLQRAIAQYGATIGSHNGGLSNSYNLTLTTNSYDFYHWGPDEVLDFSPPAGYASGQAYALASLSKSFADIEGWGLTNASGLRFFTAPSFNGTRERSLDLLQQLHVAAVGEEKLSPFPHFIRSTETPGKSYSFVNMPVSDWYVGNAVAQSMESGHTTNTMEAAVDFYYGLGTLINLYSHSSSAGGTNLYGDLGEGYYLITQPTVEQAYVNYSLSKPRVWPANAEGICDWWLARSNAQISASTSTSGELSTTVLTVSGARDPNTAVEVLAPDTGFSGLQVRTNGTVAGGNYRVNGQVVKVWVGTNVSTVQVQYTLNPAAVADYYQGVENTTLSVGAPGVLTNDTTGASGGSLSAVLVSGPAHGSLTLNADGSFAYTPVTNFSGTDSFTYQASDGVGNSAATGVTISVFPPGALFFDNFTRATDPGPLTPWTNGVGNWTVTGGQLVGSAASGYGMAYVDQSWTNFWLEAQIKFSATGTEGGGIGGRFDPDTGQQYAAWVYPEGSTQGPSALLQLVKYNDNAFDYTVMREVTLTNGVGTNWHDLKLRFEANAIQVFFDRSEMINVTDDGSFDQQPAYAAGGISTLLYESGTPFTMLVDNVVVTPLDVAPVLVVTPDNQVRAYGATNPALTGTMVGLQGSDTISATYTTVATPGSPVGTYAIVPVLHDPNNQLGNYLITTNSGVLTVTQAVLTVTAKNASKTYGQTLSFAGTEFTTSGLLNGDSVASVSLNSSGSAPTATVASSPYPIVPASAVGTGLTNYTINYVDGDLIVTPAPLACTPANASRAYGAANPAFSGTIVGLVNGDNITVNYTTTATVNSPVGNYPIDQILNDPGNRIGNYSLTLGSGTLTVTQAVLTVTATSQNKVYDGTTSVGVTLSDNRVPGDNLTTSYASAAFADKKAGTGKTVTVSGISISGPASGNYTANTSTTTTANITPLGITGSITANNKVYDGTPSATIATRTLSGVLGTDSVSLSGGTASFANKSVGVGKTVTASGLSLLGADAANYSVNSTAATTADITALTLTIMAHGVNKVYDGGTNATVTLSDNRLAGDVFTDSYASASFADKKVGNGKPVSVSGITISGTDAANYSYNTTAATTANITALTLAITAQGISKVYDGGTNATVNLSDNRLAGDVFTDGYASASFADKKVGNGKPVSVSGITISGTDAVNYSYNTTAATTANITALTLAITAQGINKVYDGGTNATVTLSDNRLAGDVFTDSYASASFADKNVGTGKPVSVSGITISGTDAANYSFNSTAVTTANITALTLTITAHGVNKVYDGGTNATVTLSDNRLAGDVFTDSYAGASFADKNVGTGKPVSVSGITISGTDAANYSFNSTAVTTANITALTLTITAHGVNKVYDGGTNATVTLSDNRLAGDVFTDSYASASFADKKVGNGKPVSVGGITISGADAANYSYNTTAATTANITALTLTITAHGVNKVYDGGTNATVTLSDNRLAGDVFTDSYASASFVDKNVGNGKPVSVSGITISGTDAANYSFNTSAVTTADVTALTLTITAHGVNKVYDGGTNATVTLSDNRLSGDVFTDSYTSASFADKNVGTSKPVSVSGITISGTDAANYSFNSTAATTADITAVTLTITAQGINKVYDGGTNATVTLSDNRLAGDVFTDSYASASFADKNVGTSKPVSVSGIAISGTDAANYSFNTSAVTTADITALTLTITAHGVNKVYDGGTNATVTLSDNRLAGDVFTDSYAGASFADKNVANGKPVSVGGITISGADAPNYSYNSTAATTANITALTLTITAHGVNKVYDGGTNATVTLSDNRLSGDVFTDSYTSASFADKNVGTSKPVSVSGITISGTDAANYSFNSTAATTADITAVTLTITAQGINKVYDGGTNATVTLSDNRLAGDVFTDGYASASFADKKVGNGKPVSVSGITISGTDAANYSFNSTAATTADITALTLTVTAHGVNKVYDGGTNATVTLSDNRLAGDVFTDSYASASFADKNVANGKPVSVSGIAISGTDAANYSFNSTAATTANITALTLTITAQGINKVYDGGTNATVTLSDNRLAGDGFTDSYAGASFADKNVANGKPVSVSGITISGTDAANYSFNSTAATTADITALTLTITAQGINKVYDGGTNATVTLSDNRLAGDVFTDSYAGASFADKNVGTSKPVSVKGITISGTDAANYSFNSTAATTADITALTLTITAHGVNKVYDGGTNATVTLSDNRLAGDVFTDSYASASFVDKNVGNGKPVSVSGITISGTDAANYSFNSTAATTADITALTLTIAAQGINKVYDGGTNATVTLSDNRLAGDVFTDSYAGASFADKNVGTSKPVSVNGITISGTDAANYSFNTTAATTADITALTLTITAHGVNKVYDGGTNATVTLSDNRLAGDVFTDSYANASFADKNVGTSKPVSVGGITISGTDAANYSFNSAAATTADITALTLTITAQGINKVYDGGTNATVTLSDNRLAGDVFTDSYASASFADKNVGTGKPVSVSGITISGTDAANYSFNTSAATTASITALTLTITAHGVNKVYDGGTNATVTLSDNRLAGDVFTDSYASASFADKNVGTGKPVSVSGITISGTDAANYSFNSTAATTADITALTLTITAQGINKVYDGGTNATVTLSDNRLAGDVFTDSYANASFADKNVGTSKPVSVSGITISGTDAANYSFNTSAATTASITALTLTITAHGVNKVYDGGTNATVTLSDNRLAGDVFTDSYASASFADKNVGTGKPVSVSGITISGTDAANYSFNSTAATTADITALTLTITAQGINKVYDGGTNATVTLSDNRLAGDVFTDSYANASFADKNVGTSKPVSVSGITISGTDAANYSFNTTAATTADITALTLTITAQGIDKVYDGGTNATVTLSDNRLSGDVFTDTYANASFADKNVGNGKPVSVSGITISGTDAANYSFNSAAATTADITALTLTITAQGINKVYDGGTNATVTLSDNRLAGDVFTDSYASASFADKNVGTGKPVSVNGITISGTDAANYSFNTTAATTADITALTLTITAQGINKVYDGGTNATVTLSDNRLSGDVFTDSYASASFADKNVGTSKPVSVKGITISGPDAANYSFNTTAATTADITALTLTITAQGINKVYDGGTNATVTLSDNRLSGDVFTDSYAGASFADKNVGTSKPVSVSGITISGPDAANYSFNTTAATTADITALTLTITAQGINKVYDGGTNATVTLSDNRLSGDVFTDSYAGASFADKNVGNGKPVSVSGITISGTDAANYSFNSTAATTANITALTLTITAQGINKVYDGGTNATVALSDNRLAGDVFTDSYASASFADKNVGTSKPVSVSGITISGPDAANYSFNTTAVTTADITALTLTITAQGINKVYDGGTNATVTLSDNRLAGDVFTDSYASASFADKNVGNGKPVSVSGITISGTDAANYSFNTSAVTTADVTALTLTITAHGLNKVYDGGTNATVTLSDNRLSGDVFTDSYASASFADKNVGTGKPVSVSGITISGTDAANYSFNSTAVTTADITALTLTITAQGINKVYDATTNATVTLSDNRLSGDVFTDSYASASFADKNVANGKPVSVSGITISGTDAANYSFNSTAATTANITALTLTITAQGINKVYDATTNATVTLSDNRLSGDVFTDSYASASFADKNVGTSKPVSVKGITISGTDAANYSFNSTAATTADITALTLTITAQGINKVYDGGTNATVTLSDNRLAGDVFTDSYATASFADKNVGTGKPVSVSGITISGTDAANYSFNTTAATTADITALTLTITAQGINKVYDGGTNATVTLSDNRLSGDVFTDSYASASFADKNVGTSKPVSVSGITISGTDAANYSFNSTAATTADITALTLTVTAQGINKVYDGGTNATVTLSDNRLSGDVFTDSYASASFADKNVGNGKPVSVSGITISGTDAANYSFNSTAATTADITALTLTITAHGMNKVYDGGTNATVTLSDNRLSGDLFTDSYASASFADKNVGTSKPVSVKGITISGTDAANYSFNTTAATTADITALTLTVTAHGVNKVYDGGTNATVTLSDNRLGGDVFTDSYAIASFADKNVGTSKPVSVSGITISGTDAANYSFNSTAATTADITALTLTVTAQGINKVYDGGTNATVTLSDNRLSGDVFTDSYASASFADKNVGNGKPVSVSGITISGTDAANYSFNITAATTANITPATLTVSADNKSKYYGATNPVLTATVTGYVDPATTNSVTGSPSLSTTASDNSPVGSYPITAALGTLSSPNYTFTFVPGALTVMPLPNTPPVLSAQPDRSLVDLTTLTVVNTGTDSDVPAQTLTYQLLNPVAGMQITANGVISWTPTLAQSPSTNVITTVVTDNGTPPMSATNRFTVVVSGPYDGIDLTDPAQALADLDGDGLSNLMEYGLGTDPRNSGDGASALQWGMISDSGNRYVALEFKRRKQNGGINIQYIPEVSGDPQNWLSDASHVVQLSVTPIDAQFDWVTVRDTTPTTTSAPRSIRVRIVEN